MLISQISTCENGPRQRTAQPLSRVSQPRVERQFITEAAKAKSFGRPITARLLEALSKVLPDEPRIYQKLSAWPGDLASDAVAFRLNGALQSLYLSGAADDLAVIYSGSATPAECSSCDIERALKRVLCTHAEYIDAWLNHPTQTNEVGRCAGLIAVLSCLNHIAPMPVELFELGASAGLNLNFAHYGIETGATRSINSDAGLVLRPDWRGNPAPVTSIDVEQATGVDLCPVDLSNRYDQRRLEAYIWPDDAGRRVRLRKAIKIADKMPPRVEQGRAGVWIKRQLATPQNHGTRRVIFHSMTVQYMEAREREMIDYAVAAAGSEASRDRPLVRIGIEWNQDRTRVEVRLTQWDGGLNSGASQVVADCHPYGEWFNWYGLGGS